MREPAESIEEFAAAGYTHIEANCSRNQPSSEHLDTLDALARPTPPLAAVRCKSIKPWRLADVLGTPQGRRD